jgi:hypothetical protein
MIWFSMFSFFEIISIILYYHVIVFTFCYQSFLSCFVCYKLCSHLFHHFIISFRFELERITKSLTYGLAEHQVRRGGPHPPRGGAAHVPAGQDLSRQDQEMAARPVSGSYMPYVLIFTYSYCYVKFVMSTYLHRKRSRNRPFPPIIKPHRCAQPTLSK